MEIVAFIIAIAAFVVFAFDWHRTKALIAGGLALLTAAWIIELIAHVGSIVTIH